MIRALAYRVSLVALLACLFGCSSPNPKLYSIAPIDGRPRVSTPAVILMEQVGVERYLERSQIVRSSENYRLEVMSNDWWGEPLGAMLTRVLVTELGQRLPRGTVISETGAVSVTADATIAVNVRRLDEDAAGRLVLQAQGAVAVKGREKPLLRTFRFDVDPPSPGTPGQVAAISTAVAQLADGLAAMIAEGVR
jgi:uncharacterized lipoprotein YmbA